jgi:hypothetical protein
MTLWNGAKTLLGAEPDRLVVQIEADHVAKPEIAQHAQIGAGAGARIKRGGLLI